MQPQVFDTKPLLRPDQMESAKEEIGSLESKLSNPLIQDKGEVRKQLTRARKAFEEQSPRPPQDAEEEERMVRRERELFNAIVPTMCSQEEMRKAPHGAVTKFLRGEGSPQVKRMIQEWKHIRLRLTAGSGDRDAANLEKFRPTGSTLNMDSAQIPGKQFFMPATNGPAVTFSDQQIAYLKSLGFEPGLMTNDQRGQVKEQMSGIGLVDEKRQAASEAGKRGVQKREAKKRQLSEAQKAAMKAGREAAAARKAEQPKE